MIFPLRYGNGGQVLSEPWHAADSDYWRTPRTWHTWCRRCRKGVTTHDTEQAAAAADEAHECRRRDLYEARRARSKAATAAADAAATPPRTTRKWTPDEDDIALTHDIDDAMAILDRSRRSVASRVERLRREERRAQ